ncbi:hypothetical protein SLE2022_255640 [Rubroshorea leprosula]
MFLTFSCSQYFSSSSRIKQLSRIHTCASEYLPKTVPLESDDLLKDCAVRLESRVQQIIDEYSDVGFLTIEDLDAFVERLKEELKEVEAENAKISGAIEVLSRTNKTRGDLDLACFSIQEDQLHTADARQKQKFQILELDSQIEKNKMILKSLQDLDVIFRRFDTIEQIEDAFTGLKVFEFDRNCIRRSLKTYIPKSEHSHFQQHFENIAEPSEMDHEVLVEIMDGTMELKNVEMFPNDVYIGDIVDAAKSYRHLFSKSMVMERRSSLQWFVGKVQDRIILSTLRRTIVKSASKLRLSFEYIDRDEIIVAHLIGGVDAFIKVFQGWPLSDSPLKLISVKSSDPRSRGTSLSLPCKVELLVEKMRLELQSGDIPEKDHTAVSTIQ